MPKYAIAAAWISSKPDSAATIPITPAPTKMTGTICGVMMVIKRPAALQKPVPRMRMSVGNDSGT